MANARSVFLAVIKGDASQAVTEFNKLGQTVEKSTGKSATAIGKFKTLGSAAMAEIGMSATTMAATAATAIATFAITSANNFTALAKSAGDLSKATGLTIEQSSRWIALADDYGVGADSLASAIGRINKNLDSKKFEQYGIATRDAAGNALSSQQIFLNVLDAMNRTPDAGKRAKMGTDLMGRGWQSLAPILGKSRNEYEDMLAAITEGQVVTDDNFKSTEEYRLANDALSESLDELKKSAALATVELAPLVELLAKLGQLGSASLESYKPITDFLDSLSTWGDIIGGAIDGVEGFMQALGLMGDDAVTSADAVGLTLDAIMGIGNEGPGGISMVAREMGTLADNAGVASDNVLDLKSYFVELLRAIDEEKGLLDIQDSFDDVRQKAVDAFTAAVEGAEDADEKARDYRISVLNLRDEIIKYGDALGDVPPEVISEIDALIDEGKLDEAEARLNALARFREATIGVRTLIGGRMDDGGVTDFLFGGFRAGGGPVSGGTPYVVGERGPELFVPGSSGSVVPNHALGGGGITLNVTVTNPVASGEQLANELAAYTRRYGSNWLVAS